MREQETVSAKKIMKKVNAFLARSNYKEVVLTDLIQQIIEPTITSDEARKKEWREGPNYFPVLEFIVPRYLEHIARKDGESGKRLKREFLRFSQEFNPNG